MTARIYICDSSKLEIPKDFSCSDYRIKRAAKAPTTAKQGIAAEFLLYKAVSSQKPNTAHPLNIHITPYGKPYIADGPEFSLSHSGELACCAVADSPVGVDIQHIRGYSASVAERWFSKEEREYIDASSDRDSAFTLLWTARESYVKAAGGGIGRDMGKVNIHIAEGTLSVPGASLYLYQQGNAWLSCCVICESRVDFTVNMV